MNKKIVFALALISVQNIMPVATPPEKNTGQELLKSPEVKEARALLARIKAARGSNYLAFGGTLTGPEEVVTVESLRKLLLAQGGGSLSCLQEENGAVKPDLLDQVPLLELLCLFTEVNRQMIAYKEKQDAKEDAIMGGRRNCLFRLLGF